MKNLNTSLITIWVKITGSFRPFKQCELSKLSFEIGRLRKTFEMSSFAITKGDQLPTEANILRNCPVTTCATCPKAVKKGCLQYKYYRTSPQGTVKDRETNVVKETSNDIAKVA